MRASFVRLAVATLVALLVVSAAPAAGAHETVVVFWKGAHAPGLNTACPEGTKSVFVASLHVQKGEKIVSYQNFKLRMKQGSYRYASSTKRVKPRLVRFFVKAGQNAKVNTDRPRKSYAYPVELTEGARPWVRLKRTCA